VPVQWASVGIVGADVERLTREGLPKLKEKISTLGASLRETSIVVVLVVGVNDLRELQIASYRSGLRRLVDELRFVAHGEQAVDAVFLPALSIADAPLFQSFPLQYFMGPISALWEREKRKAIKLFQEAEVLTFPTAPSGLDRANLFCKDRVHPSVNGYELWGDHIAQQIHTVLRSHCTQIRQGTPEFETNASLLFC